MKPKHPRSTYQLLACAMLSFAAVLTTWADYPSTVTNLNPVGYWRLNEPASTNIVSLITGTATNYGSVGVTGNGRYYSLTNVGVLPSAVAGDTAPYFNNTTNKTPSNPDYLEVDNIPQLLTNSTMSIEIWVLRTNVPPVGAAFSGGFDSAAGSEYKGFMLFLDNNGGSGVKNYYCRVRVSTGGTNTDFSNVNCSTGSSYTNVGSWDQVVFTWNTTNMHCYVNGLVLVTNIFPAGKWYCPSTIKKIRFGGDSATSPALIALQTMLAHAAIYPYELTYQQITNHLAATNSAATYKATILADNPVGYWPLNESGPFAAPSALSEVVCTNLGSWGPGANGTLPATAVFNTGAPGVPYQGFGGATCATFPGGAGTAVTIPPQSLNTSNFSISLWHKLPGSSVAAFSRLFNSPVDSQNNCGISYSSSSSPGMQNNELGAALTGPYTGTMTPFAYAPSNQWVFLTMVADTNQIVLYVNGLATTNSANTTTVGSHDFSLNNMLIGNGVSGFISDVAVFDYALTPAQVTSLYAAAGVPPSTNTLQVTAPDSNGNFVISGTAGRGQTVNLWQSTNLTAGWMQVGAANGDSVTGGFTFTNSVTNYPQAFYELK